MINIAVVDDDADVLTRMSSYITKYFKNDSSAFKINVFSDGLDLIDNYKPVYDVIFLDIQMKHSQGLEVAHRLREQDKQTAIVFVTNLAKYAIEGYSVQASDYLLKPFTYETFSYSFDKVLSGVVERIKNTVDINVSNSTVRLSVNSIIYVEVNEHLLTYHTTGKDYEVWDSLANAESKLQKFGFAKCNNCYLVNLQFVKAFKGDYVTVADETLKVSRTYKQSFKNALVLSL